MEAIKGFFDSFKEFIWDIIGYLLPGSYIIILLSVCIKEEYFVSPSLGSNISDLPVYVFIVISYLLGHAVYGFGWIKEELLGKYSYRTIIEEQIKFRKAFILSRQLIEKSIESNELTMSLENVSVREVRNIAMSFVIQHDQKIYTFTFRSDLSNHAGNISFIIGFLGLLFSWIKPAHLLLFKTEKQYVLIYVLLIASFFLFRKARDKFYAVSISLPFSIYTAYALKKIP